MNYVYRIMNAIGLLLVLVMNGLAEWLPLGGHTTGEISAQYPVLITPAGYAFSIWSVIYALLIGFVIYSFTPSGSKNGSINVIGPFFFISCLLNSAWIAVWHYEKIVSSVFVMLALLLTIIVIYTRIKTPGGSSIEISAGERWFVQLPFSLYLGWISVATIVNIATALYASQWDGFGISETAWTIIMLTVAMVLALIVGWRYRDAAFVAVFIWAFVAISVKQHNYPVIMNTAIVYACILGAFAVFMAAKNRLALTGRPLAR